MNPAKALCCSIAQASVEEIDQLNILQATMLAMRRAVSLCLKPVMVLVDGNRIPQLDIPAEAIVKGDALVQSISAASILAKVHRDRWCAEVHGQFLSMGLQGTVPWHGRAHGGFEGAWGLQVHHRRSFYASWPRC